MKQNEETATDTVEIFERIQELHQRIDESADYQEGIRAFREKRKPVFAGRWQTGSAPWQTQ